MANNKHLQHVKSNVVNNGSPKLPTTEQILLGEIGINYANGYERMSIKNDANEIVEFVSKEYVVGKNEIDTVVSTAIQQAITADPPTADQEALINAIQNAVSKAIQETLSSDDPTADQEALINAISDAVTKALQDALSAIDPTESQEALIKVIYETLTKAIQEALAAENPTVDQKALLKAISDAVAKAIQNALDPEAQDKTIVEQINNIIGEYVYENGGTSISLTDVMENSHTHENKSVLDGITQEKVTSWDNAVSGGVTNVAYDIANKKITKTVGTTTSDVVTVSTLKTDMGLNNVGNFKSVSTVANQGLSSTEQSNARINIGAGTSSLEIGTTATTAAAGNHTHGNITNDGKLNDTAAAAVGNDYLVIRDADDSKIQTSTIKGTDVADAVTNKHSHSNKSVLDNITSENITSWNNAASGGVTNVGYNATNKEITQTIGGETTTVVNLSTLKGDLNLTKSDVGLGNVTNDEQVKASEKGVANGVAELDANGKVPSNQLPSYVDDVIEGYYYNSKFYKEAAHTTLITGESDKIYVDLSKDTTYRCSNVINQTYTQIKGDLALGETETTAYRGDRGKIAYDHSQAAHAPANATVTSASTTNGNIKIDGTETTVYTHPTGDGNSHVPATGTTNEGKVLMAGNTANSASWQSLGTAAKKDVPTSGDASTTQVVMGNDTRLANNVKGPESSLYGSIAVFDGTTGKSIKQIESINANEVEDGCVLNVGSNDSTSHRKAVINIRNGSGGTSQIQASPSATTGSYFAFPNVTDTSNQYPAIIYTNKNKPTSSDVGLGSVGNFKAVSTVANQGLSATEQSNARVNIGAGTSSFSGNYNDLTNKIVFNSTYNATNNKAATMSDIPTVNNAKFSINGNGTEVASTTANASTASSVDIVAGSNVTVTPDATTNKITIAATDTTYVFNTAYNASTNKAATMKDIPTVPSHGTAESGGTTESVVTTGEMYNWNAAYGEMSFLTGSTITSEVEAISIEKRLVICTATSGQFSLASLPPAGHEIHVLVTPTSSASLAIPHGVVTNAGVSVTYVNTNDGADGPMSVSANGCGEINAISDGTKVYIRYVSA